VADDELDRDRSADGRRERGLDRGTVLGALLAVGLVGDAELPHVAVVRPTNDPAE
jgi:hypothetical protein